MTIEAVRDAVRMGRAALSEYESKLLLASFGVPVVSEELVASAAAAVAAAERLGFPVAMKACSPDITHKTERRLVELDIGDDESVIEAFEALANRAGGGIDGILVQKMVSGGREFVAGLARDATFGPVVMFGLGGVMAEAIKDVAFRIAPLKTRDARAMLGEIRAAAVLGKFRDSPRRMPVRSAKSL